VLPDNRIEDKNDFNTISGQTSASDLRTLIKESQKYFDILSIDDALTRLKSKSLKRNALVLTFDDGFIDNYSILFPILKEEHVPATYFINPSVISSDKNLWFQSIINIFFNIEGTSFYCELNDITYDISSAEKRFQSAMNLMRYLQSNHNPNDFHTIIQKLGQGLELPKVDDKHMTWDQLKELSNSPLITIGAHTFSHYPLTLCDSQQAEFEIVKSKTEIEKHLNIAVNHFSFPRGHKEDFNSEHITIIKREGMKSSGTTIRGYNLANADDYQLKRVGLPQYVKSDLTEALWYVLSVPQLISKIKSKLSIAALKNTLKFREEGT
jgi:peptidoglycan/xylan/chitin deacetylase (PgdA/CDA1 family)